MRIIAGTHRRRVLETPPDASVTRPMPDMVREALFNLLRGHTEGASVFDAFAGTGSVGLEALSRGASRCVFIERDRAIGAMLQRNVDALDMGDRAEVVVGDALGIGALARCPRPVHLIFFDPPYPLVRSAAGWARVREQFAKCVAMLDETGYAVLRTPWPFEHEEDTALPSEPRPIGRRMKPKGRGRGQQWDPEGGAFNDESSLDDPKAGALGDDTPPEEPPAAPKSQPARFPGDLHVPAAIGPETHPYGGMALHLYMRDRSAAAAPGTGGTRGAS